jgi:hypothetical protein
MNEMDLLTRFRDEVPQTGVSPHAEDRFRAVIKTYDPERVVVSHPATLRTLPWRRTHVALPAGRRARLALAGALSVAVAASVTVAVLPSGGRAPAPATPLAVQLLADRAAAAALARPPVAPGQWVYRKATCGFAGFSVLKWGNFCPDLTQEAWSTADGRKAAFFAGGKLYVVSWTSFYSGKMKFAFPLPLAAYSERASLPADPQALVARLSRYHGSYDAFWIIGEWLANVIPSPVLTAELYHALAYIPGVKIDEKAVDSAGGHGVGFTLPYPEQHGDVVHGWSEIVVNPRTYQFMGWNAWDSFSKITSGSTVVGEAFVSGPGVRP